KTFTPGRCAKSSARARRIAFPSATSEAGGSTPANPPPVMNSWTNTVPSGAGALMRPIPVIDIKAGRAVRAVACDRPNYETVRSILPEGSDPTHLALAYRDVLGLAELYLAALDAIAGAPPALPLIRELVRLGLRLWVDAGLRDRDRVYPLL